MTYIVSRGALNSTPTNHTELIKNHRMYTGGALCRRVATLVADSQLAVGQRETANQATFAVHHVYITTSG